MKQELLKLGWPAEDLAGYTPGTPHPIDLAESDNFKIRDYQRAAVDRHRQRERVEGYIEAGKAAATRMGALLAKVIREL